MFKGFIFLLAVCAGSVSAQTCWTNTAGHAFHAELVELTDRQAIFVMSTGETNTLGITALSPASEGLARSLYQLAEIPDGFQSTFNICQQDLIRIHNLYLDDRLNAQQRAEARNRILLGFKAMYQKHDLPPENYAALKIRLLGNTR